MRPQAIRRPGDCLATAIGALLDIDALELPHTGGEWESAWQAIRSALAERGWRLSFIEWAEPGQTLADLLAYLSTIDDPIENALLWIVGVTHPSFRATRSDELEAHAVVLRGAEIAFDPGGDVMKRPPLDELVLTGSFPINAIDPAAFVYMPRDESRAREPEAVSPHKERES